MHFLVKAGFSGRIQFRCQKLGLYKENDAYIHQVHIVASVGQCVLGIGSMRSGRPVDSGNGGIGEKL